MATRCRARSTWANTSVRHGPRSDTTFGGVDTMSWTTVLRITGAPRAAATIGLCIVATIHLSAQQKYDLLLKGGHVIDARNNLSAVRDVAIAGARAAALAANINVTNALKVVDASSLYITPGLIDIHVHVYAGTGE